MTIEYKMDNGTTFDDEEERDRILRSMVAGNKSGAIRNRGGCKIGIWKMVK